MKRSLWYAAVSTLLMGAVSTPADASWLSKITGIHINPSAGRISIEAPQPQAIPEMLKNLPKDAAQFLLNPAGSALAEAIRVSRNMAIGGAQPIPPAIRQQLTPFFPAAVLDRARYNTNKSALSLQGIIHLIDKDYAITLDDLIVFPDSESAQNAILWAHELTHVSQYANMGVESFANVYSVTGGTQLERQARDWENRVKLALQSPNRGAQVASTFTQMPGAFQNPITPQDWQVAARQIVPPNACAQWGQIPGGAAVQNVCPVAIVITSFGIATPYGPQPVPCVANCVVLAGSGGNFGPAPGPVIGLTFVFPPM